MTIQKLAQQVLDMMQTKTRDDGSSFVSFKNERPDWMQNLAYEAHSDMLPDDHKFGMIQDALQAIADSDDDADLSDVMYQIEPDHANHALLGWLNSNLTRASYVNQAVSEGLADTSPDSFDLISLIRDGQAMEMREVFGLVQQALEEQLSEIE